MSVTSRRLPLPTEIEKLAPLLVAGLAFFFLYLTPMTTLVRDWWNDPEASHGLLLGPLALWLAWRSGVREGARGQPALGIAILVAAVLLRYLSGLAAELFTMRFSLFLGAAGIIVFAWGFRQLLSWWLPAGLLLLSIPLPSVVLSTLAFPLQLRASELGAAMLEFRQIPVHLAGNVIYVPGQSLFVTEACSGLRSLTALLSLGFLMGGLWLKHPVTRIVLLAITIPVAIVINGVRVFLTGFLVVFVDPALGQGFMHMTEGWAMFVIAFAILGALTWIAVNVEAWILKRLGGDGDDGKPEPDAGSPVLGGALA